MTNSWKDVLFADLGAPTRNAIVGGPFGSNLVSSDYVEAGVPVVRGQNMAGRWIGGDFVFVSEEKAKSLSGNLARPGDLIFTQRGTLGQVSIVPNGKYDFYLVSQSQMKATVDKERADAKFLYYFFSSEAQRDWIKSNAIQTGVPHTNLGILKKHPVQLPPLCEQQAIATVLSALDDKIEQNRRTGQALEGLARATFNAWFVDFEPVQAKAAGQTSFPGVSPPVFAALPDRMIDSPIGRVPCGWAVRPLTKVANFLNGLALQKYPPVGDETDQPVIKIADLRKGSTDGSALASAGVPSAYVVGDGDLLFSWSGTLEVELWFGGRGALNQHLFKVTSDAYPRWLCLHWVRQHLPEFRLIASSKATTMGHIKRSHLEAAQVVVPDVATLAAAEELMGPIYKMVTNLSVESRRLATLRDYLLPKLLRGRVRVRA